MQWLVIKCLEWNLYSGHGQIDTQELVSTGRFWGRERGPGVDWCGWRGGGYLDGLRFRHSWSDTEAWPVICYKRYIPRCRPYHPLPVKYEDDRVSERNQWEKSEILVRERNQRGVRNVSKKNLAKMSCLHIWKGCQYLGTLFIRMIKLYYEFFLPDKRIKESNKFFHKMGSDLQWLNQTPDYWGISGFYPVCWLSQCYLGQPPQGEFSHAEKFI